MTCNNCLQEILQGESFFEDEDNGTAYHADCRQAAVDRRNRAEDERAAALARAEAAEAERNELRERHDNLKTAYANLVEEAAGRLVRRLVRMYAAERRVAALEAQLAAQGWRPISTDPNEPGMYIIMDRSRTYAQVWWWIEETYEYESGDEYNECPLLIPAYWNASPDGDSDCLELDGADADAAYWQRVLPPDAATEQTA